MPSNKLNKWQYAAVPIFWGEVATCNHLLQVYETDDALMGTLGKFAETGLNSGDSVIIIATKAHVLALSNKLLVSGHNVELLQQENRFIALDAEETLSLFMVEGDPDPALFRKTISGVVSQAKRTGYGIKAFGEMVAVLWANGQSEAALRLEQLWNEFCREETLCLFCAYPQSALNGDEDNGLKKVCDQHSHIIAGSFPQDANVYYKQLASVS